MKAAFAVATRQHSGARSRLALPQGRPLPIYPLVQGIGATLMDFPTDLHKWEEAMSLVAKARVLIAAMGKRPDDLESLLSVAASEFEIYSELLLAGPTKAVTIPLIISESMPTKPKRVTRAAANAFERHRLTGSRSGGPDCLQQQG